MHAHLLVRRYIAPHLLHYDKGTNLTIKAEKEGKKELVVTVRVVVVVVMLPLVFMKVMMFILKQRRERLKIEKGRAGWKFFLELP